MSNSALRIPNSELATTLTDLCTYELPHAQILTELLVEYQHDHPADEPDRAAVYVTISTLLDKITTQIQAVIPRLDVAEERSV